MNRSRIEYVDHTWNPITGCRHDCPYCYARRMAARFAGDVRLNKMAKADYQLVNAGDGSAAVYRLEKPMMNETGNSLVYPFGFEPTYHMYRMDMLDKLKMGNNIFVGAMADMFGSWVPDEWIREILDVCMKYPIHNYLFLTKNPRRYGQVLVPTLKKNMWYGTSVTRETEISRLSHLPAFCNTFVSIEPLLEDIYPEKNKELIKNVEWIIIGAETGQIIGKVIPSWEWIEKIVLIADDLGIPVFMKNSLIPIVGEENMRRDYPEELQKKEISVKMEKKIYGICDSCKSHMPKREMIALCARYKRGEHPKQFAFMCKSCFMKFCEGLEVEVLPLVERKEGDM